MYYLYYFSVHIAMFMIIIIWFWSDMDSILVGVDTCISTQMQIMEDRSNPDDGSISYKPSELEHELRKILKW